MPGRYRKPSSGDPDIKGALDLAAAARSGSTELAKEIRKEITALKRSQKSYWRSEAHILAQRVLTLRSALVDDLAPQDSAAAIKLIQSVLDTHEKVFNQVDDSNGCVWPVYQQLVEDLGELYAHQAKPDRHKLAKQVFEWVTSQQFNVYDYAVRAFSKALGDAGLDTLEQLVRAGLSKPRAVKGPSGIDFVAMRACRTLEEIADARNDVDGYIKVLGEFGVLEAYRLGIAERLVGAGRYQEALEHLARHHGRYDFEKVAALKVKALTGLGDESAAQECRVDAFLSYPDPQKFNEILSKAGSPQVLRRELLDRLDNVGDPYRKLAFLINVDELQRASALVLRQREHWNGQFYQVLQPSAQALAKEHPLAASILYRALINDVLGRAQSKYYHHAVRYLKAAAKLAKTIKDWADLEDHEAYLDRLREDHKRKQAFWARLASPHERE